MAETMTWDSLGSSRVGKFETTAHYDHDSDSVSVFITDEESYRERVDPMLTVYRGIKTKEVVGCQIKHVKRILSTMRAFKIGVTSGEVTIGLLLMGLPLSGDTDQPIGGCVYREIVRPIVERVGDSLVPELV